MNHLEKFAVPVLMFMSLGSTLAQESNDRPSNVAAPTEAQTVVVPARSHAAGNAQAVAFSRDGKLVAAGFGGPSSERFPLEPRGGGIAIWDVESGRRRHFIGEYGDILKLEFSHDGKSLAYARVYTPGDSVDDDAVVVVDVETGRIRHRWGNFRSGYQFLMLRPANQILVGRDVYELSDFSVVKPLDAFAPRCLAASVDGGRFAAIHQVEVPIIWPDGTVNPMARSLVMKGLALFDGTTFEKRASTESMEFAKSFALTVSPDGTTVVTGHSAGVARVWAGNPLAEVHRMETGFRGHVLPFFAPDGRSLALAAQQTIAVRWKYDRTDTSGFEIRRDEPGAASEVVFFDTKEWKETARWQLQDAAYTTYYYRGGRSDLHPECNPVRFAFSPDGTQILAGCNGVVLIDVPTGKIARQFELK